MTGGAGVDAVIDVLVIGGGVCGLWTLHALRAAGYDAWLLERSALGDGQTIASQGILHAGAKYEFAGDAIDASDAVADVQPIWANALGGGGGGVPDLSSARVIDRRTILWTRRTLGSNAAAEGAKRFMRSEVRTLPRSRWPLGFESAPRGVRVFETREPVLDPSSLIESLRSGVSERAKLAPVASLRREADGVEVGIGGESRVKASAVVLCSGEGNEPLLDEAGAEGGALMQRRPLHQLVALGAPFALNGHCLKLDLDKPELTVTTGELEGKRTWYFGGGPAEDGVGRTPADQIEAGRAAVSRCLPWVDHASFDWRVFEIDRAEARTPSGKRPSEAAAVWSDGTGDSGVLAVWPTKLVLAPRAATLVLERLAERGLEPSGGDRGGHVLAALPEPPVAERVW